eukprot:9247497-Pyramimonas_sp.AAC.1
MSDATGPRRNYPPTPGTHVRRREHGVKLSQFVRLDQVGRQGPHRREHAPADMAFRCFVRAYELVRVLPPLHVLHSFVFDLLLLRPVVPVKQVPDVL